MNNSYYLYVILFLSSVLISSVSQLVLKKSALKIYDKPINEYINPMVITAYILFFSSSLLTTLAYRRVDLSLGPVLETTGYIYITLFGYFLLKEKQSKRKIVGNILIIFGIFLFTFL